MRDRSRDHSAAPGLQLIAFSSVAITGAAIALSGLVISGVSIYRNITSKASKSPEPSSASIVESTDLDTNSFTGFQTSASKTLPDTLDSEANSGIIRQKELLALETEELENKITSFGEQTLVNEEDNITRQVENRAEQVQNFKLAKGEGTEQYAAGQYQAAVGKFKAARDIHKNSPENLIYLNNALANQAGRAYTLAVTVPLKGDQQGADFETAMGILKGVAHAQDDINKAGGIQGVPLKLLIVNDFDDSSKSAETVAQILTKNQNVLGVVGHDDSNATLAARKVYENSKLVSISPTSTSAALPPGHTFAFRTVPNDIATVEKIAAHMLDHNRSKVAVFYEADNETEATSYSEPVKEKFETFVSTNILNGKVVQDFNLADLDSDNRGDFISSLEQLVITGAIDTVMLMPSKSDNSVVKALEVAALSRKLSENILIIGNDAMYDQRISKYGEQVARMVAVSFWDTNFARTNISSVPLGFVHKAFSPDQPNSLWDTDIHWTSAMAYDAVLAFGQALKESHPSPTRTSIATSLSSKRFSVDGATGIVKFDNNGDRIGTARLVKLLPTNSATQDDVEYEFQPIFSE